MTVSLALVTCTPQLEAALAGDGLQAPSIVRLAGVSPRSTLLLAAVDLLFEDAGVTPAALERVLVTRGPGSFTGIRSGLATAAGLASAVGLEIAAFDSLTVQAARCEGVERVWAAQPGRRGEVYARAFRVASGAVPEPLGELEIAAVQDLPARRPWAAAECLDLGGAERAATVRTAAEALLHLADLGAAAGPATPLYVEGPPLHGGLRE